MHLIPVILCGGSGTRLWPLSRELYPKQFLNLTNDRSLLQNTIVRSGLVSGNAHPIIVANEAHRFIIAEQLRTSDCKNGTIILEPVARNTAPAIAAAALIATKDGADPILLVMPSDHLIIDDKKFIKAVEVASENTAAGKIVTFGITPTAPETGYGYIGVQRPSELDREELAALPIFKFAEKPNRDTAKTYIASGDYYWNSGIFMFKASTYLNELGKYAPDILRFARTAVEKGQVDLDFFRLDETEFENCPSNSIDYAVMEKTTQAALVPLDAGWSDVGAWDAVWQVAERDASGNATSGDTILERTRDCLVHSEHRLVATIGIDNLIIVETPDVVLVSHRNATQDVKRIVEKIQVTGRSETKTHRRVYRPWGEYDSIDRGARHQVKCITVQPGAKLSVQMHHHRAEHWVVVSGTAKIRKGEKEYLLSENESTYIPVGEIHSLENPGKIPLEIIEIQTGSYLGEDDIVRLADSYGRT